MLACDDVRRYSALLCSSGYINQFRANPNAACPCRSDDNMNSSYEFIFELMDELLLKYGHSNFSNELNTIQEQLYTEFNKIDTIKNFLDLLEYL